MKAKDHYRHFILSLQSNLDCWAIPKSANYPYMFSRPFGSKKVSSRKTPAPITFQSPPFAPNAEGANENAIHLANLRPSLMRQQAITFSGIGHYSFAVTLH